MESFPLVGRWTVWRIGNGREVRLGEDLWIGVGEGYQHSDVLFSVLHDQGMFFLSDAQSNNPYGVGANKWKSNDDLGISNVLVEEWKRFFSSLCENFMKFSVDHLDTLAWSKNQSFGCFTTKLGYTAQVASQFVGEKEWRKPKVWKLHNPLKSRIVLWLALKEQASHLR